jgi:hypothetical protein
MTMSLKHFLKFGTLKRKPTACDEADGDAVSDRVSKETKQQSDSDSGANVKANLERLKNSEGKSVTYRPMHINKSESHCSILKKST